MNISLYIAKRYAFTKTKSTAINFITAIASVGIIAGAMALFVVMSVFSGLKEFSLSFANSVDPDLKIEAVVGKSLFLSKEQETQLKSSDKILSFSKVIEERVFFLYDEKEHVAYLKGVDSLFNDVTTFKKEIYSGNWFESGTNGAVMATGISRKLSAGLLDFNNQLQVFVPKPGKGTINSEEDAFRKTFLLPVGIYYTENEEIDNKYVFCDIEIAQQLMDFKANQFTNIELKLKPNVTEEEAVSELNTIFKNKVKIKNRAQLNDSLYKMLNTENIAVYSIFTLVIILTLFTLAGALIMMIIDKKNNLKTLFSLGVDVKKIRTIFFLQGGLITFLGGILGLFLGIIIVLIQQKFQLIMITENLAYPIKFEVFNIIIVCFTIFILGLIASWIASNTVSKKLLEE